MTVRELVERKKRGKALSKQEIGFLVDGFTCGRIPDYQMAAFLMAVYFQGLDRDETLALVDCMMKSGRVLDLSEIPGPKIDKHSTGGVGDKVSLPLAGVAAACGLRVPMLSGRGLGHTGGTLDKLESIPGYSTTFREEHYRRTLRVVGATIVGQSDDLVPADRELYALRDVTATVDSIPLIVSSILSKKFAAGVEGVVLDVKVGTGAFMRDLSRARMLAELLADVGQSYGRKVSVLLTRMDEPLGIAVGNAVEVAESVDLLRNEGPADLRDLVVALVAEMLCQGGLALDTSAGTQQAERALASGAALTCFKALVKAHGGSLDWDRPDYGLDIAPVADVVRAPQDAWLRSVDGTEVGLAVVDLGGGRLRRDDEIDPGVGLLWRARPGQRFGRGDPIAQILARPGFDTSGVVRRLEKALDWSDAAIPAPSRILERLANT